MDSEIFAYTLGYMAVRLAFVAAFVWLTCHALRAPDAQPARSQPQRVPLAVRRANAVFEDRC